MELFRQLKKVLRIQFIDPNKESQHSSLSWRNLLVLLLMAQLSISALAYCLFEAKSNTERGDSFYIYASGLACGNHYLTFIIRRTDTLELIQQYNEFVKRRLKDSVSKRIYMELNERIEKISKLIYVMYVQVSPLGFTLPALVMTAFNYFVIGKRRDAYVLPFYSLYPFDWKTPIGYLVPFSGQYLGTFCDILPTIIVVILLSGSCWLIMAFFKDISRDVSSLNESMAQHKSNVKEQFGDIIQQYTEMRKFSFLEVLDKLMSFKYFVHPRSRFTEKMNNIYKFIITAALLWSLITICSSLVLMQLEIVHDSLWSIESIHPVTSTFWAFGLVLTLCELGEIVSNQFDLFYDELCQCDWYLLPNYMQRNFQIMMIHTQQPVIIHGIGNAICTRSALKSTVNAGFSYFMLASRV